MFHWDVKGKGKFHIPFIWFNHIWQELFIFLQDMQWDNLKSQIITLDVHSLFSTGYQHLILFYIPLYKAFFGEFSGPYSTTVHDWPKLSVFLIAKILFYSRSSSQLARENKNSSLFIILCITAKSAYIWSKSWSLTYLFSFQCASFIVGTLLKINISSYDNSHVFGS